MKPTRTALWGKLYLPVIFLLITALPADAQAFGINTDEIESIINEWNFAHQQKSLTTFKRLYAKEVLFDSKTISGTACVSFKGALFKMYPSYRQEIQGPVHFTAYSSGIIKTSFKAVVSNAGSKSGVKNEYLLVSYDNRETKIVGEGDSLADAHAGFRLSLGEPIVLGEPAKKPDTVQQKPANTYELSSLTDQIQNSVLFSNEVIEIPIRYVVIISTILLVTFSMLIGSIARLKKNKISKAPGRTNSSLTKATNLAFQRFVVTLFDPLYFTLMTTSTGGTKNADRSLPDLQFRFRKNEVQAIVSVNCLYFQSLPPGQIRLISSQHLAYLQQLAQSQDDMEYYLTIGSGGRPDDPGELYLVPVDEILSESLSYHDLQLYRKHGMFFYNATSKQLK